MSNDSKFWVARLILFACIAINLSLLADIRGAAMNPDHPHLKLIVTIFILVLVLSLPITLYYYYAKARRWEDNQDTQNQIALETLAKLGEQRKKDSTKHLD